MGLCFLKDSLKLLAGWRTSFFVVVLTCLSPPSFFEAKKDARLGYFPIQASLLVKSKEESSGEYFPKAPLLCLSL